MSADDNEGAGKGPGFAIAITVIASFFVAVIAAAGISGAIPIAAMVAVIATIAVGVLLIVRSVTWG